MIVRASSGSSGSGTSSIIPDTSQVLGAITTNIGTYTATENCIMQGSMTNNTSGALTGAVYATKDGNTLNVEVGTLGPSGYSTTFNNVFIPKGYTISVYASNVTYSITFYKIDS